MNAALKRAFESIEARKSELLKQLEVVDETTLTISEGNGKWSVIQVIRHISLAEEASLQYCKKKMLAGEQMPNANFVNSLKMKSLSLVLYSNIRYKMPVKNIAPEESLNFQEVCIEWYNVRETLRKFLEDFPDKYLSKAIYKHPVAGRVNLESMLWSFDGHLRHHEFQIDRILKKVRKP